jgi:hypothetical protein
MRWETLFADLEAQAAALARAERSAEIDDRTRAEAAGIALYDRLRAAVGQPVRVVLAGAGDCAGTLTRVGVDWLLLDEGAGRETVAIGAAVVLVRGLTRAAAVPGSGGVVASRLGVTSVLRGVARDRLAVRVLLRTGVVIDATVDRVGADYLELALHEPGEPRRPRAVRETEVVPFTALAAVRRIVDGVRP